MSKSPTKSPTKVGFVSLGCPKNLVDSEVMMGLVARAGAELTPLAQDADVLVVNTCSLIDAAKQESVNTILEMARYKSQGHAQKLVVAGCLVERYREEIRKNIPEVDAVVGTGELDQILGATGIQTPDSPFVILKDRATKNTPPPIGCVTPPRRFRRDEWDGASAELPDYLYDEN